MMKRIMLKHYAIIALMIPLTSAIALTQASAQVSTPESATVFRRIVAASVGSANPKLLASYRHEVSIISGEREGKPIVLPVSASAVYSYPTKSVLRIRAGNSTVFNVVNGLTGWHISGQETSAGSGQKAIVKLNEVQFKAQADNARYSLAALLLILSDPEVSKSHALKLQYQSPYWIITLGEQSKSYDFYFSEKSWLCEKRVTRGTADVEGILAYEDYGSVQGILLPHKTKLKKASGEIMLTTLITKWVLGEHWPEEFFTAEGVKDF